MACGAPFFILTEFARIPFENDQHVRRLLRICPPASDFPTWRAEHLDDTVVYALVRMYDALGLQTRMIYTYL